jgi:ABC-type antimicrobial peptide transport system permease subunit
LKNLGKLAPGQPFQYSFLDEDFGRMYSAEHRLGKIFVIFAGLAIVIACLGLFALTSFTAEQRTKEIGIRKVLGASVGSIVFLLSKEFGKLIVVAFVISVPLAWYGVVAESYVTRSRSRISLRIGWSLFVCHRVGNDGISVYQSSDIKPCQFAP